ncbi:MAG: glycosyltransferase, partial [Acetobacteraceae bacterium]|nr:glycosyltransferase [Acetobacteraceae bacterium]
PGLKGRLTHFAQKCGRSDSVRPETTEDQIAGTGSGRPVQRPIFHNENCWLYRHALAVLYPTLYEGFGVPALNAQAVGTPVVFSDVSSLRELVGPTSIALDPEDNGAWIDACRALIGTRLANPAQDRASMEWARQFSWERSAAAHWEVYREAAAGGRPA